MRNTEAAFRWITAILREQCISYQVTGGFAAHVYGSVRPLADIDIEVRDRDLRKISALTNRFATYPCKRYQDAHWDVLLMTLKRFGQTIDLIGIDTERIYDCQKKQWGLMGTDFDRVVMKRVFGLRTPVIRKADLIAYKHRLGRGVDIRDAKELRSLSH